MQLLTDEDPVEYAPERPARLIRNRRVLDVITVPGVGRSRVSLAFDGLDVAETSVSIFARSHRLADTLSQSRCRAVETTHSTMVTMFAARTRRSERMLRMRRALRAMKTGPDGRDGRKGLIVSPAILRGRSGRDDCIGFGRLFLR